MKHNVYLMECPVCGGKVSNVASFCPHCGTPMNIIQDMIEEKRNEELKNLHDTLRRKVQRLANGIIDNEFKDFLNSENASKKKEISKFDEKLNQYTQNKSDYEKFYSKVCEIDGITSKQKEDITTRYLNDAPFKDANYWEIVYLDICNEIKEANKTPAIIEALFKQLRYKYHYALRCAGVINHPISNPRIEANYSEEIANVVMKISSNKHFARGAGTPKMEDAKNEMRLYGVNLVMGAMNNYVKSLFNKNAFDDSSAFVKDLFKIIDDCTPNDVYGCRGLSSQVARLIPFTVILEELENYKRLLRLRH